MGRDGIGWRELDKILEFQQRLTDLSTQQAREMLRMENEIHDLRSRLIELEQSKVPKVGA